MAKLKLGPITDDKPVKITLELPARLHRDLTAYAEILGREAGQPAADPVRRDRAEARARPVAAVRDPVLADLREQAERTGRTVAVYHWHHVEVSMTRRFACMAAALDGVTLDLLTWFNSTFRVRREASIKHVAQLFGFVWAVDDPGGRLSMNKIETARGEGPDALEARQWCLRYNESDVAAQAAIRDGIREMF